MEHLPLAWTIAGSIARRFPPSFIAAEDLVHAGVIGLARSIERFDPEIGIPFRSYAAARMGYAMWDEIRELDWIPRSQRARYREYAVVRHRLEQARGETASHDEITEAMGLTPDQKAALHAAIRAQAPFPLESGPTDDDGDEMERNIAQHGAAPFDPDAALREAEIRVAVRTALSELADPRWRDAFRRHYLAGETQDSIAARFRVTPGRVSQILTLVRGHLQNRLRGRF